MRTSTGRDDVHGGNVSSSKGQTFHNVSVHLLGVAKVGHRDAGLVLDMIPMKR